MREDVLFMNKISRALTVLIYCAAVLPLTAYGDQKAMFEHRYEYKLEDVLPATKFVQKQGYWEGYRDGKLVGYVGLSKDWTPNLVGYSGKHLETLMGMDKTGAITGVKLVYHSEPIVLIGLKEESYHNFIKQYAGKSIKESLSVGGAVSMDALTGATVTAMVQNSIILETLRKIAARAGIIEIAQSKGRKISQTYTALTWNELVQSGAVKNISVTTKELGISGEDVYLDLFIAVVTPPSIGRNLLGEVRYQQVMAELKPGETAVAVFSRGKGSFKGTGFVRGGVFDRFNIEQGTKMHMFNDKDYRHLSEIQANGAPSINEGGVFILRDKDFDPCMLFKLNLMLPYRVSATDKKFKSFSVEYGLAEKFLK
jgi:NosR/NirI family transcriptional regulator, nitrous oxide reductase regulator